ncbi:MAG: hypothetical protein WCF65_07135 [Parachlamydiaceae bacterium]
MNGPEFIPLPTPSPPLSLEVDNDLNSPSPPTIVDDLKGIHPILSPPETPPPSEEHLFSKHPPYPDGAPNPNIQPATQEAAFVNPLHVPPETPPIDAKKQAALDELQKIVPNAEKIEDAKIEETADLKELMERSVEKMLEYLKKYSEAQIQGLKETPDEIVKILNTNSEKSDNTLEGNVMRLRQITKYSKDEVVKLLTTPSEISKIFKEHGIVISEELSRDLGRSIWEFRDKSQKKLAGFSPGGQRGITDDEIKLFKTSIERAIPDPRVSVGIGDLIMQASIMHRMKEFEDMHQISIPVEVYEAVDQNPQENEDEFRYIQVEIEKTSLVNCAVQKEHLLHDVGDFMILEQRAVFTAEYRPQRTHRLCNLGKETSTRYVVLDKKSGEIVLDKIDRKSELSPFGRAYAKAHKLPVVKASASEEKALTTNLNTRLAFLGVKINDVVGYLTGHPDIIDNEEISAILKFYAFRNLADNELRIDTTNRVLKLKIPLKDEYSLIKLNTLIGTQDFVVLRLVFKQGEGKFKVSGPRATLEGVEVGISRVVKF